MAEIGKISAELRDRAGKGAARAARRDGRVPAVIYGNKQEPVMVTLLEKDVMKRLHTGGFFSHLLDVEADGASHRVLPKDVQFHPVTDRPIHVDFLRVSGNTKIAVHVPVHFTNEKVSPGIDRGGLLNIVRHDVELWVAADNIPESIEVDLASFDIGDSIHISHISLPEGATPVITDRDFTVATIVAPVLKGASADSAEAADGEAED